jgi:hypothetical protein
MDDFSLHFISMMGLFVSALAVGSQAGRWLSSLVGKIFPEHVARLEESRKTK